MSEIPFLEIENFSCGYETGFQIRDMNISIGKGKFGGIIGPNGCGKTTFFKGITGILHPKEGGIKINGNDLQKLSLKQKARKIALVTQHIEAGFITVEDYVLMGRMPYLSQFQFFETKRDIEIAENYLKQTDTFHLRHKLMNELSGGEQQLASIARALTQEPELLLLDEPTSHLDITHQIQILNQIQRLNNDLGLTVLMVIHDLNLASEYCDHLVLMNKGRIFRQGIPEEVLDYKVIEDVYKTVVVVEKNPISKKPIILLVSERELNAQKSRI